MNKPAFRHIAAPLEVDDAALDRVADEMGVPRLTKPSPPPLPDARQTLQDAPKVPDRSPQAAPVQSVSRVKKPGTASISRRTALEKLTVEVPGYLIDAVKQEALDEHTSARHVLMLALREAGFKIDDADMIPDGRRRKTRKP